MAYKVFTNGSVLNASEINDNLMNQSVMVFSNSTTRAAALTAPVEGMLTWLEDVNRYEYRSGAGTWLALIPNSGMDLLVTENFSAVTEVLFTSRFTAAYRNYYFTVSPLSASVDGTNVNLQLRNATTNQTAANYQRQNFISQGATNTGAQTTNQTSYTLGLGETIGRTMQYYIFDPQGNTNTAFQGKSSRLGTTNQTMSMTDGAYTSNYSADGFRVFPASGNITGTISLYGLKD
jgi:hypothetical protein